MKFHFFFFIKFQYIPIQNLLSIFSLLGFLPSPTTLMLQNISEWLKITNLDKMKKAPIKWDFTQKFIVMYGIAKGMNIIHKNRFIQVILLLQMILNQ